MSFQHYPGSFTVRSGTGTQTITGVGFQPKAVWFFSPVTGAAADDYAIFTTGFDDGTTALGTGLDCVDDDTPPQKVASSSQTGSSIVRVNASVLTPVVMLAAHIDSMNADGFVLSVTTNTASQGERILFLAMGGSDLDYSILQFAPTVDDPQVISGLTFAPKALIAFELGTTGAVGVGGGLALTFVGTTGIATYSTYDGSRTPTSECQRYLRNGRAFAVVSQGNNQVVTREADSVTLTSDGFSIHWSTPLGSPAAYAVLALGGAVSGSAAGVLSAEVIAGTQTTTIPPITPTAVVFGSVGHPTNTTVDLDMNMMIGAADLSASVAGWCGCLDGVSTSVAAKGSSVVRAVFDATAGNPGSASAVLAQAALTGLGSASFTLTYDTLASPEDIAVMYLALGTTAAPIPPPSNVTTYPLKRVRVFSLPSDLNYRLFLRELEILVQSGVGLNSGQGSNPTFTVEISRDGGMTYGPAYTLTPGKLGDYAYRPILNRLGWYRNATVRLTMSDPVQWAILDAFIDVERGAQ